MTGMPSFGGSHDSSDLWDIVAYVMKIPTLSSEAARKSLDFSPEMDSSKKVMVLTDKGIGPLNHCLGPIDQKLSTPDQKYSIVPVPPATC